MLSENGKHSPYEYISALRRVEYERYERNAMLHDAVKLADWDEASRANHWAAITKWRESEL